MVRRNCHWATTYQPPPRRSRTIRTGNDGRTVPDISLITITTVWRTTRKSAGGSATTSFSGWDAPMADVVCEAPVLITRTTSMIRTSTTKSGTRMQTLMKWPTAWMPRSRAANAPPYHEDDVAGRSRAALRVIRCHLIASPPMAPRSTTGASSPVAPAHRVNILPTPILLRIAWRTFLVPERVNASLSDRRSDHHLSSYRFAVCMSVTWRKRVDHVLRVNPGHSFVCDQRLRLWDGKGLREWCATVVALRRAARKIKIGSEFLRNVILKAFAWANSNFADNKHIHARKRN